MRFLVVLVLSVCVGAGGWLWYRTTTPEYAISRLGASISSHDMKEFEKYASVDTLSDSVVDGVVADPIQKSLGKNRLGQWLTAGLMGFMGPDMTKTVRSEIRTYVGTGSFDITDEDRASKEGFLSPLDKSLGFTKLHFAGIDSKEMMEKKGRVTLLFNQRKGSGNIHVSLLLKKVDHHWKVASVSNIDEVMSELLKKKGAEVRKQLDGGLDAPHSQKTMEI